MKTNPIFFILFFFNSLIISAQSVPQDIEAEFPGGFSAMTRYISSNIVYPSISIDKGLSGKVYVNFIVQVDGSLSDFEIVKGVSAEIDVEAIRVVQNMPAWNPASLDGKSISTRMTLPINFQLEDNVFSSDDDKIKYEPHWAAFDIGFVSMFRLNEQTNSRFDTDFSTNDYWQIDPVKSLAININFLEYKLPIFKQYLGLTTGLGYGLTSLGLRNNYRIQHSNDTVFCVSDTIQSYKTNTLAMHRFTLPLLLEFTTKPEAKKSFYLAAGVIGALRFASTSTQTGEYANGDKFTNNTSSRFNLQHFSLDATVRAGFGKYLGAFVEYSLTPLFKKGSTIAIYPIRFGLSINVGY